MSLWETNSEVIKKHLEEGNSARKWQKSSRRNTLQGAFLVGNDFWMCRRFSRKFFNGEGSPPPPPPGRKKIKRKPSTLPIRQKPPLSPTPTLRPRGRKRTPPRTIFVFHGQNVPCRRPTVTLLSPSFRDVNLYSALWTENPLFKYLTLQRKILIN